MHKNLDSQGFRSASWAGQQVREHQAEWWIGVHAYTHMGGVVLLMSDVWCGHGQTELLNKDSNNKKQSCVHRPTEPNGSRSKKVRPARLRAVCDASPLHLEICSRPI